VHLQKCNKIHKQTSEDISTRLTCGVTFTYSNSSLEGLKEVI